MPEGGLSPLTRGTLSYYVFVTSKTRFIPADAGNTMAAYLRKEPYPVYPR
ncbi:hypothetical protein ECP03047993_4172 [Escherichia coli P0304799.3]|nr:hypothetical protein ECP03047993_4172 [Escherichia coli P0304799.3]